VKPLGARVDALTIAFRVRLDVAFVQRLKQRADVAREHGRASFEWVIEEPDTKMGASSERRLGPQRARWADDFDRLRRRPALWGELGYSTQRGVWRITNEPYFRIQIQENAAGGGKVRPCGACRGLGWLPAVSYGMRRDPCRACRGVGHLEDPGWTIELIWYAQELARIGLGAALKESQAIAGLTGEVLEARLRRIDLCADIEGWEISPDDVKRLAKRPRARWAVDDVGPRKVTKIPRCTGTGACRDRCTCQDVQVYGTGSTLSDRRISGLAVGRGGALMCRIYDKRCELENDRQGERRAAEEARWSRAGWKGQAPIARVEFQIRGVALSELGLRDPDAAVVPIYRHDFYTGENGKMKFRAVVVGEKILTVANDATGKEEQATIVHRLEAVWRTCLDWVRLVEPEVSASGKPIAVSRLADDPRWALLRTVKFAHTNDGPIRRYRPRAVASSAQALGVVLSQAGREGQLEHMPEGLEHYGDDEAAERQLYDRVLVLFTRSAENVTRWLIDRFGGVAGASVHLAVRSNASRARFLAGVDVAELVACREQSTAPQMAAS